jgi:hypothetical protein
VGNIDRISFPLRNMLVSSAKSMKDKRDEECDISLTYIRNRRDPRIEP